MPDGTLVLLYHRVTQLDHDPYASPCTRIGSRSSDVLRRRCDVVPLRDANGRAARLSLRSRLRLTTAMRITAWRRATFSRQPDCPRPSSSPPGASVNGQESGGIGWSRW